jgi:hypothetical protein
MRFELCVLVKLRRGEVRLMPKKVRLMPKKVRLMPKRKNVNFCAD